MSELEPERGSQGQLFEEAAAWFARMRGPDAEAARDDFEAWLGRGALHRGAYNRAAEIFSLGKVLDDHPAAAAQGRRTRRLDVLVAAALFAGVAGISGWLLIAGPTSRTANQSLKAARSDGLQLATLSASDGERRDVLLSDGSRVRLAGATLIRAQLDATARVLVLRHGFARFAVARERRPFVVLAGGGAVTAHGTMFDVRMSGARRVSVRLLDGIVDVRLPMSRTTTAPTRRLRPGETISFAAAAPSSPAAAAATPGSARDYIHARVAEVVAEANRHGERPIRLADRQLGEIRVSGRFSIDDTDSLAERLSTLLDLEVDRRKPAQIVLRPR